MAPSLLTTVICPPPTSKRPRKPGSSHTTGPSALRLWMAAGSTSRADITFGADGKIYVANRSKYGIPQAVRVTILDLEENFYRVFGSKGREPGQFILRHRPCQR